jgi:hypothetical protein
MAYTAYKWQSKEDAKIYLNELMANFFQFG